MSGEMCFRPLRNKKQRGAKESTVHARPKSVFSRLFAKDMMPLWWTSASLLSICPRVTIKLLRSRISAASRRLSILLPQLSWSTSCAPLPRRLLHVRPPRLLSSPGGSGLGSGRRAGVPATNSKSARRRRAPASLPNARVVLYKGPPAETLPRETVWWITSAQSSAVWRRAPGATLAVIWSTGKPP